MTQSLAKWALHSIDRPAMLTSYLRFKKFWETAGAPNQAIPSRLRGDIRIPLPFLPEWMGKAVFVDPLRMMLPFDSFGMPYEQYQQNQMTAEGRTERILTTMVDEGQITTEEAEAAMNSQSGDLWEQAYQRVIEDEPSLKNTTWDMVNLLTPFHAPLVWAYEAANGTPEDIAPFSPMSRTIRGAAGLMGVDWDNSPLNIEARVRKHWGLPAFDKWTEYRQERMLANLAATGAITVDAAMRAMIEHEGDAWDMAVEKEGKEFGVTAAAGTFGLPLKSYPEGEFLQRNLTDDYQKAWELYD